MKAAPPIEAMEVLEENKLRIKFEGMPERYVDLTYFPLLGIAKKLLNNSTYLKKFEIVDGIPEWEGKCLLGPEDLLKYSKPKKSFHSKIASYYREIKNDV